MAAQAVSTIAQVASGRWAFSGGAWPSGEWSEDGNDSVQAATIGAVTDERCGAVGALVAQRTRQWW